MSDHFGCLGDHFAGMGVSLEVFGRPLRGHGAFYDDFGSILGAIWVSFPNYVLFVLFVFGIRVWVVLGTILAQFVVCVLVHLEVKFEK